MDAQTGLKFSQKMTPEQKRVLYNIMFAEVGGGADDEAHAVASTFLNNVDKKGFEKAARMSSAYLKRSPQYQIADTGAFAKSPFETKAYLRNKVILDQLSDKPEIRGGWTNFENVKAYGDPDWAKAAVKQQDIGRQRFYVLQENPRAGAIKGVK